MEKLNRLSKTLNRCGYQVKIFSERKYVLDELIEISRNKKIGFGSSLTIEELSVVDSIKDNTECMFLHKPGQAGDNERNALLSDIFITSANAVSMNGEIVNIDGTGNRVAATCFGPGEIIYLIGKNKITDDLESALTRAKTTAIRLAARFNRKTPCVKTGKCSNCFSPECVCSITTIHRKNPYGIKINIFLIDAELGL